jgi:Mrp family chromosome partitioning ATPase
MLQSDNFWREILNRYRTSYTSILYPIPPKSELFLSVRSQNGGVTNKRDSVFRHNTEEPMTAQTLQESMASIKHKFLVMSSKGGVRKTSVIVNLAMALSRRGMKVGLMDVNFHSPDTHTLLGLELSDERVSDNRLIPMRYSDDLKVASVVSLMQDIDETGFRGQPLKVSDIRRFITSVN